ncbi:MAG: hypothetical protein HQ517_09830 [SAR324 cluster bacterium]|nr:hypothetical protein [SAR324 cluster bacterium]
MPKYFSIIKAHKAFLKRISVIEIAGHTDEEDKGGANPRVSRDRAGSVLSFLTHERRMRPFSDLILNKTITAGYANIQQPAACVGKNKCAEARRVEITIKLDEKNILTEIHKILVKEDSQTKQAK